MDIARSIERWSKHSAEMHQPYHIVDMHHPSNEMYLYPAYLKQKKLASQITIVFATLRLTGDDVLEFQQRPEGRKFMTHTAWRVARTLGSGSRGDTLQVRKAHYVNDPLTGHMSCMAFTDWDKLHPYTKIRAKAVSRSMKELDKLGAPAKPKKKSAKVGRIRIKPLVRPGKRPRARKRVIPGIPRVSSSSSSSDSSSGASSDDDSEESVDVSPVKHPMAPAASLHKMMVMGYPVWYQRDTVGEIWHADRASRLGRLTGPFGRPDISGPHALSWSMVCNACGVPCKLVKSNKQLEFDEEHLIKWLLLATLPDFDRRGAAHKADFSLDL